jgi:hypothetical protein
MALTTLASATALPYDVMRLTSSVAPDWHLLQSFDQAGSNQGDICQVGDEESSERREQMDQERHGKDRYQPNVVGTI